MSISHPSKRKALREKLIVMGAKDALTFGPKAAAQLTCSSEERAALSPEEEAFALQFLAMLEAVTLVAGANGDLSEPEVIQLLSLFQELSLGQLSPEHAEIWLDRFLSALGEEGFAACLAKNAQKLPEAPLRRAAFFLAVSIAYIDSEVDDYELSAFHALAEAYQIPLPEAQRILEEVERDLLGPAPTS